jgi:hypothetical protein
VLLKSPRLAGCITITSGALPSVLAKSIVRRPVAVPSRWLGCFATSALSRRCTKDPDHLFTQ